LLCLCWHGLAGFKGLNQLAGGCDVEDGIDDMKNHRVIHFEHYYFYRRNISK
jgi:hypothetical protein